MDASLALPILVGLIAVALLFDFLNGLHDAANSIATIVSTRVLRPHYAVAWAAFFNFVAFAVFGLHVAETIGTGIIHPEVVNAQVIFAALIASDQGGRWERCLTLIGPRGRLRVHDFGYEWIGLDGEIVDSSTREQPDGDPAAEVISEQIRWLLDPARPAPAPSDVVGVYALAQAALLSASTGAGESPATIRRVTSM